MGTNLNGNQPLVDKFISTTITKYVMSGLENRNVIFVSEIEKDDICFKKIFILKCPVIKRCGDMESKQLRKE